MSAPQPSPMSAQLAELRRTRYAQVPRLRHVMQVFLASAHHSEENRAIGRTRILDWARSKWPGLVPAEAYDGAAFDHDQAGLRIAATGSLDDALWTFRSEHLCNDSRESRTWVTEAIVGDLGTTDVFGVRNSCSTLGRNEIPATSPRFLRDLVSHHALMDGGVAVTARPYFIGDEALLTCFLDLLMSRERTLPVVVLTLPPQDNCYPIDPYKLAKLVQGLAHVCCVPAMMTFRLSDAVGKPLSVFHGAVRTYNPGFAPAADQWQHPLVLPQRIADWSDEGGEGAAAFEQFLVRQLHAYSVSTPDKLGQLPSYNSIRRALLSKPNTTSDEEIQRLRLEIEDARDRAQEWQAIADDRDAEAIAQDEENRTLRAQNLVLAHELKELRRARGEVAIPVPDTYAELPRWVDAYLADRVFLHARAARAVKDAVFENVGLVYEALKLLADAYWPMKSNQDPAQRPGLLAKWEDGLRRLKLEYNTHAVAANRVGEFREAYTINYRIGQSSRQLLGPHLKFGSTKDDRFCLRIYFLWDDDRQLVVVGHLPSHLETRAS